MNEFTSAKSHQRRPYLDGIRGIAALTVMLGHMESFVGVATSPTHAYSQYSPIYQIIYRWTNEQFAVCIFFVLSGFVLLSGFSRSRNTHYLADGALKRYFRLTPMAFSSVMLTYFLWRTIGYHAQEAAIIMGGHAFLAHVTLAGTTFAQAIYQGLIGLYRQQYSINGVVWTLCIELYGTLFLYAFVALFHRNYRYELVALTFGFWLTWILGTNGYYICLFLAGSALIFNERLHGKWYLIFPAIYLGSFNPWARDDVAINNFLVHRLDLHLWIPLDIFAHGIGAVLLISSALGSPALQMFFMLRPIQWLGRVSFALYVTHISIMYSIGMAIFSEIGKTGHLRIAAIAAFTATTALSMIFAEILTRWIDQPSQGFSKWIVERVRLVAPNSLQRTL